MNLGVKVLVIPIIVLSISVEGIAQSFEIVQEDGFTQELNNTTGIAVADYDQDGDLDLFVVSTEVFDKDNPKTWSRLLQNDGLGGYTDVTITSGLINWQAETRDGTMGSKMGASWGDYDNDGYPDIFIANYGFDELWHNEGDGTFRNVTDSAGVAGCFFCYSMSAVWWDYDQDGDLDLYVSDWLKENRFFRNEGNGEFTDISLVSGLNDRRHTFSSLPIDLNQDGWLDLYVINDIGPNHFFWNRGDDLFVEASDQVGLVNRGNGMGVDICDFNNDGWFDIYVTNIFEYVPNPFFVNQGNDSYADLANQFGIDDTGWGWGARFFDADHDLDEDLYVVNGFFSPLAEGDRNQFFRNDNGVFSNLSRDLGVNSPEIGMGLEVFDYDQDGDQDMLVGNRMAPLHFYENQLIETKENTNWLQIKLEGTKSNRNGFGATIIATVGDQDFYRYHSGVNLFGQSVKPVHFGLANHIKVNQIQVNWPSGLQELYNEVAANQIISLTEGSGEEVSAATVVSTAPELFNKVTIFPNPFTHNLLLTINDQFSGEFQFSLMDALGRKVFHYSAVIKADGNLTIPISIDWDLKAGLYFYELLVDKMVKSGKLIKK